jgi:alanine racemase
MNTISPNLAGAVLTIDIGALKHNYKLLSKKAGRAVCAAAIKADAYGVDMAHAAPAFWQAGCQTFFVSRPQEGEALRNILPEAVIYVLDGLYSGQSSFYAQHKLRPALVSIDQVREWAGVAGNLPCALHVDTGINRMGLTPEQFHAISLDTSLMQKLNISLLMSHLACADSPDHPLNEKQRNRFSAVRALLPHVPASISNSSGIFLGKYYHLDLVRPGIALYGGNPIAPKSNPMRPVASLKANIMHLRDVKKGETVGYSATWKAPRDSRIAIVGAGYADGISRHLSSRQKDGPAQVWLAGRRCPVVGRVSMDMMGVDVTDVKPSLLATATQAEIFGFHISVDEAANWAGTISYELLTGLGSRYARVYKQTES